jgi:hypothetical protein
MQLKVTGVLGGGQLVLRQMLVIGKQLRISKESLGSSWKELKTILTRVWKRLVIEFIKWKARNLIIVWTRAAAEKGFEQRGRTCRSEI